MSQAKGSLLTGASSWWKGNTQRKAHSKLLLLDNPLASPEKPPGERYTSRRMTGRLTQQSGQYMATSTFLGRGQLRSWKTQVVIILVHFLRIDRQFRGNMQQEYSKNLRICISSFSRTFGLTTLRRSLAFKRSWIIAWKMTLSPSSLFFAVTLRASQ